MTKIKDLPGASTNFRVNVGVGNFSKKFTSATRAGELSHLSDNRDSIIKVLKKNETAIRRGTFSRLRQIKAWSEIKKLEGSALTKNDTKQIKSLLKYLSTKPQVDDKPKIKIHKQLAKDESFEKEKKGQVDKSGKVKRQLDVGSKRLSRPSFANQSEDSNEDRSLSDKLLERRFRSTEENRVEDRINRMRSRQVLDGGRAQNISFGSQLISNQNIAAQNRLKTIESGSQRSDDFSRTQINKTDRDPENTGPINPPSPFQNL